MTLLELLNKIIEENKTGDLLKEIHERYFSPHAITPTNYEKTRKAIGMEIDCLLNMKHVYGPSKYEIRVVKILEHDGDEETYSFDVFAIETNTESNSEHYGIELMDWEDIVNSQVNSKSILRYGIISCVAAILYNLSFFGFDYTEATKRQKETLEELEREMESLENVTDVTQYHTMDDIYKEFDLENPSEEKQKKWQEEWKSELEFYESECYKLFREKPAGIPGDARIPEINKKATD